MRFKMKKCIFCGLRFTADSACIYTDGLCICSDCAAKLPLTAEKSSFATLEHTSYLISPLFYTDKVRQAILEYKFHGSYAYAEIFTKLLELHTDVLLLGSFDLIIPVPLSRARLNERGYNQSELIARSFAEFLGIEFDGGALVRIRHTKRQSSLRARDRAENVKDAFAASRDLSGKRVIIFDDIYTSGHTMDECAKTVQAAGADTIIGLTLSILDRPTIYDPTAKIF